MLIQRTNFTQANNYKVGVLHTIDEFLKGNPNLRNGYNNKQLKSSDEEFELSMPRDRESTFEPQIVKKHQMTITDKIIARVKEWWQRLLEVIYSFVMLDAIHYKVKENDRYTTKAVYMILGGG
ncbi:transposase [Sulfurimonas sp. HSL3-7]|uniref:transposase n=1 Tax=Sulfonitrofixus jiaomeiensis TaxID=3131938 RepID=UPI0031F7DC8A